MVGGRGREKLSRLPRQAQRPWEVEFKPIAQINEPAYEDAGVTPGQLYTYMIRAAAGGMEGPASFRARTDPRAAVRPIVSVLDKNNVRISWQPHPANDVAGYNIYRNGATTPTADAANFAPAELGIQVREP